MAVITDHFFQTIPYVDARKGKFPTNEPSFPELKVALAKLCDQANRGGWRIASTQLLHSKYSNGNNFSEVTIIMFVEKNI